MGFRDPDAPGQYNAAGPGNDTYRIRSAPGSEGEDYEAGSCIGRMGTSFKCSRHGWSFGLAQSSSSLEGLLVAMTLRSILRVDEVKGLERTTPLLSQEGTATNK